MPRHFTILCIGTLKNSEYQSLFDAYVQRIKANVSLIELPASDKRQENIALRKEIIRHENHFWMGFDSTGKNASSEEFAESLEAHNHAGFIIGGADGLDTQTLGMCKAKMAFGRMIWPHKLARLMLIEQLYRVEAIWANHPYHRGAQL